jgi:Cdc6-like AAA superfamily ATPase
MLPSVPKIFHGRESEVEAILELFNQPTPRIAVLGAGGMGKTSLARAVLHHTDITEKYEQNRSFVACDTVATQLELAALIGAHLGLQTDKDLSSAVVQHFSKSPPSLLILDNFETVWESRESRVEIEEFLSLLTDVDHLAVMVGSNSCSSRTFNSQCCRLQCVVQKDQPKFNGLGHFCYLYSH